MNTASIFSSRVILFWGLRSLDRHGEYYFLLRQKQENTVMIDCQGLKG